MNFMQRYLRNFLIASTSIVMVASASAQERYPSKPIRMIVAFAAGGPGDILTRLVASQLSESLGQNVIVENRPGANGESGTAHAAQSAPDGYTVLQVSTVQTISMALRDKLRYNLLRDFEPVTYAFEAPLVLVAPGSAPYGSVEALVAHAKTKPDGIAYGSGGVGTVGHLSSELFRRRAGFPAVHVAYQGTGAAMSDLIGGRLDYFFSTVADSVGNVKSGRLKALAVTSRSRDPVLPQVPTMAEVGFSDINPLVSWGFMVPHGTPAPIVKLLHDSIAKAVASSSVQKSLSNLGVTSNIGGPEALASTIQRDLATWQQVIKAGNIRAE